jgi:Na+/H+ antiporter NhaD/arsenite permease-like protein
MVYIIVIIFLLGYLCIALEDFIHINKAASALTTAVLCWLVYISIGPQSAQIVNQELAHSFSDIAGILFFLLGAMTIVELIDAHNGFDIISAKITAKKASYLLWIIAILSFFLSSFLDNLTTAIVMISITKKLISQKEIRWWYAGIIIISSNFGGAWSPIGDVTTSMLWIGGQISSLNIITSLFLPCLIGTITPLFIVANILNKKQVVINTIYYNGSTQQKKEGNIILILGILLLLAVPVFKTLTHLPPVMGMLLALGIIWLVTTILHKNKNEEYKEQYTVARALQRVDTPSILFFLGILLSVSALNAAGILNTVATQLSTTLKTDTYIAIFLGLVSALVDNVPLVAAAQNMYPLSTYSLDHNFWEMLALSTGSGGSIIIIGSAAGVAVMGIDKVPFLWYLKKISLVALIGFISAIAVYFILHIF